MGYLFGRFQIFLDGAQLHVGRAKLRALVAYLCLNHAHPQSRAQLADLLWPASDAKIGLGNLRKELHVLRRQYPALAACIDVRRTTLTWISRPNVAVDVHEFSALVDAWTVGRERQDAMATLSDAIRIYTGELLVDMDELWLMPERERLRQRHIFAVDALSSMLEERRDYALAIQLQQKILDEDPFHEQSVQAAMRLSALANNMAGAQRYYLQFTSLLEQEMGTAPSLQTQVLYEQLTSTDGQSKESDLPAPSSSDKDTALFGRHDEWRQLLRGWRRAEATGVHLFLLQGLPGYGKTAILTELKRWATRQRIHVARAQLYEADGHLPYSPIVVWMQDGKLRAALRELPHQWLVELGRLDPSVLPISASSPLQAGHSEEPQRLALFAALAHVFDLYAKPLLLIVEDLQWCDIESLEWLSYYIRRRLDAGNAGQPVMVVGTYRPHRGPTADMLERLQRLMPNPNTVTSVALGKLAEEHIAQLIHRQSRDRLDAGLILDLVEFARGNPLYAVEATRMALYADSMAEERHGFPDRTGAKAESGIAGQIPDSIRHVILGHIGRMSTTSRAIAEIAAVWGQPFSVETLIAFTHDAVPTILAALSELESLQVIVEQGGVWLDFEHDWIRSVLYESIAPIRRSLLHQQVAEHLLSKFGSLTDRDCSQLAVHFRMGGQLAEAVDCDIRLAYAAIELQAIADALRYAQRGVDTFEQQEHDQRSQRQELMLRIALGVSWSSLYGYSHPNAGAEFCRAVSLIDHAGDDVTALTPCAGLWVYHFVRAEFDAALSVAQALLATVKQRGNTSFVAFAHHALGATRLHMGEFDTAHVHLEASHRAEHVKGPAGPLVLLQDPFIVNLVYLGKACWSLGLMDEAAQWFQQAEEQIQLASAPLVKAASSCQLALLVQWMGKDERARELAATALALSEEYEFVYWQMVARIVLAVTEPDVDHQSVRAAQVHELLDVFDQIDVHVNRPLYLLYLARLLQDAGHIRDARAIVDEALAVCRRTGELQWESELLDLSIP